MFGEDQDDIVLMPYTTVRKRLHGSGFDHVHFLMVSARSMERMYDAEVEIRQLLLTAGCGKRVADSFLLRSGIDVDDDWVFPLLGEIERQPHVAVKVGDSIHGLDFKPVRHLPSGFIQSLQISLFQDHDFVALRISQHRFGRDLRKDLQ